MKKNFFLTLTLLTLMAVGVYAQSESDFDTVTSSDSKSITITKYKGNEKVVIIPEKINNLPVFVISDNAFINNKNITSITIPDSVTRIRGGAFKDCTKLLKITIPNGVIMIDINAFSGCKSLNSVTFASGSNIQDTNFGLDAFPEGKDGDGGNTLKTAYSVGKAGTYTRQKKGSTWTKK